MKRFILFFTISLISSNIVSANGDKRFYNAIDNNSFSLIESLIDDQAVDINIQDQSGKTPLMYASQKSTPDIVSFLIKKGADVNLKTFNNVTALHYAARGSNSEVVKVLIENNADINAQDFSGFTPLMRAATNKNYDNFKVLVSAGADLYVKNQNSNDALDLVINNSDETMFDLIVNPLTFSDRADIVLINSKLLNKNLKDLELIIDEKISQISSQLESSIDNYNSNISDLNDIYSDKVISINSYPCYEKVESEIGISECITVQDIIENRSKIINMEANQNVPILIKALDSDNISPEALFDEAINLTPSIDDANISSIDPISSLSNPKIVANSDSENVDKALDVSSTKISMQKNLTPIFVPVAKINIDNIPISSNTDDKESVKGNDDENQLDQNSDEIHGDVSSDEILINPAEESKDAVNADEINSDVVKTESVESEISFNDENFAQLALLSDDFGDVILDEVTPIQELPEVESSEDVQEKPQVSILEQRAEQLNGTFLSNFIDNHNITSNNIEGSYETNYINYPVWAFKDAPTNIVSNRLISKYYDTNNSNVSGFKFDDAVIKEQRLLSLTPELKLFDKGYYIQSGSFLITSNSTNLKKNLAKFGNVFIVENVIRNLNFHVVYVGPFESKAEAKKTSNIKEFKDFIGVKSYIRYF